MAHHEMTELISRLETAGFKVLQSNNGQSYDDSGDVPFVHYLYLSGLDDRRPKREF